MTEDLYSELISLLKENLAILPDKSGETHENTLRALWCTAAGHPVSAEDADRAEIHTLDGAQEHRLREMVRERIRGKPLAFLTGRQNFMGTEFHVNERVFIPRKETELLVSVVLELSSSELLPPKALTIVDVCTGSGNIPLILAEKLDVKVVYATDVLEESLAAARKNTQIMGLTEVVELFAGDLFTPLENLGIEGKVDLITCNPPYIASAKVSEMPKEISCYEPREAFDGGDFGVGILERLVNKSSKYLKKGGWLVFEVGAGQGELMIERIKRSEAFSDVQGKVDEGGVARIVMARKRL